MQPTRNIAARAGRWSAQHRRKAVLGWLAFVIAAVMIGGSVGTQVLEGSEEGVGESGRADRAVAKGFPKETADETVLVQTRTGNARDPGFHAAACASNSSATPAPTARCPRASRMTSSERR